MVPVPFVLPQLNFELEIMTGKFVSSKLSRFLSWQLAADWHLQLKLDLKIEMALQ